MTQSHSEKIDVLIVDGFSNHDWKQTSFLMKTILEESGLFRVAISIAPAESGDKEWRNWRPQFEDYDVYNSSMGHLWEGDTYPESFRCIGFQAILIRATEWLATGKTTYPLPDHFPTRDKMELVD